MALAWLISRQGRIRRVPLQWIKSLQKGQRTEVFRRHLQPSLAHVSFSILYVDGCVAERSSTLQGPWVDAYEQTLKRQALLVNPCLIVCFC